MPVTQRNSPLPTSPRGDKIEALGQAPLVGHVGVRPGPRDRLHERARMRARAAGVEEDGAFTQRRHGGAHAYDTDFQHVAIGCFMIEWCRHAAALEAVAQIG